MDFFSLLDQVVDLLQKRGRLTYNALKRQFDLDEGCLQDLKNEIIAARRVARDEGGLVLVWTGENSGLNSGPNSSSGGRLGLQQSARKQAYPPPHLADKIAAVRSALPGERKQVTVLFADLKDSTELIHGLDPEDAQQLLDPAIQIMMDAVHKFEGTVNQVLGDGIMAIFGAPIASEDHSLRGCYAALSMQTAMRANTLELRRTRGLELQMRVGLNSGEVVVRSIGNDLHMDYSAVGETTHLASRMEQMATPGTVRITASTQRMVEGLIQVTPLGLVPVKGLHEPVEVFELIGASGIRRRFLAASTRGLTPLVGRQTELKRLQQALEQAQNNQGQVIALVGEAGVGKSRLVHEFVHSDSVKTWLVLESASVPFRIASPNFPAIDLLRQLCQVDEGDDASTIQAKVTGKILPLDETLQNFLPALLALLDALPKESHFFQLEPSRRSRLTHEGIIQFLLRESQRQPLVLVFEDLHWIDLETQALLDSLVENLPKAHILLLVNYRQEYHHGWADKTYYLELQLDPLPPTNAEEFLNTLLGESPDLTSLKPMLIGSTEGNPFFLEECVRTLVETGILEGVPGAYRPIKPFHRLQAPATVHAVLAARIDCLPLEYKSLLQTAAVIGTDVPLPLLRAIADLSEEVLECGLAHLQAGEFLFEMRLFPVPEYSFKHSLTQEVAYGSMLQERRKGLHARIVEALEILSGDRAFDQVERLADHAIGGEVWDKAVTFCQQAGTRSHDRAAFREAVAYFEQALHALGHLSENHDTLSMALDLRLAMIRPLNALGEKEKRLRLLSEAEALARLLDDPARLGRVLASLTVVLRQMGDLNGAIKAGQKALSLGADCGDKTLQGQASLNLGQVFYSKADFIKADEYMRWNVNASERTPGVSPTDVEIMSQAWLARILGKIGKFKEARRHGEEALQFATKSGRGITPVVAHGCLGELYLAQGKLEPAIQVLDRGLVLCRASGNHLWFQTIAARLGYALALQGRFGEGRALLEEEIKENPSKGIRRGQASRIIWLGEIYRLSGCGGEALQFARQALDHALIQKNRADEALALHQLGVVQSNPGTQDFEPAEINYRKAFFLAEELGMRPLMAHCHHGLGHLFVTISRNQEARAELSSAINLYRSMEMDLWIPQAEAAMAQVM